MTNEEIKTKILEDWLNGFCDDDTGDVEAPTGHLILSESFIVHTDSYGFTRLMTYSDQATARLAFDAVDEDYTKWVDSNG